MTTSEQSTMIAIFANREQANLSIDNLRHAGYNYDQIRLVENGSSSFVDNLKSLFTNQAPTTTNSADDWMRIGVPEQDANQYQTELEAGRDIVLIKSLPNPEQALNIMRQSGAYDISVRLRTAPPTMAPGAYNPNAQQGTYNPNLQQGTYNPDAQQGSYNSDVPQGTYNPNAQQGSYNPDVPQGTYDPNTVTETRNPNAQPDTVEPTQPQPRVSNQDVRNA